MARLPEPGEDKGTWGDILNAFLMQSHNDDGSIKDSAITDAAIADESITNDKIAASAGIEKSKLAALNIANSDVASGAAIAQSKIANLVDDLADKADSSDVAGKLDADGGVLASDLDADSNKITGLVDGSAATDSSTVGQLAAAISDVETDLATTGTEITDLPTATRTDASWLATFDSNENFVPIIQDGVAKKMPLELITTMAPSTSISVAGTSHTWAPGEHTILFTSSSPTTVTLPTFGSHMGLNAPVKIMRMGTGTVTLQAGSSAVINKAASLPLTLRQQFSVAYFWPYYWASGTTVYLLWGDLG